MASNVGAVNPGREALAAMIEAGALTIDVAAHYKVSRYTAYYWLDRFGLAQRRGKNEKKKPRAEKDRQYDWETLDPKIKAFKAKGFSDRAIAVGLNIKLATLRYHLKHPTKE